jgi:hypothetical protein
MGWRTPESLCAGFMADLIETSAGMADFQVVESAQINDILPFKDGFRYEPVALMDVLQRRASPHRAEQVDYAELLARLDALRRVARGDFDEVWVFGYPHAGFYESIMAGAGAFFCNSAPLTGTEACPRRFIVMGFSVERGVGEMLESFGHRCESILRQVYAGQPAEANYFARSRATSNRARHEEAAASTLRPTARRITTGATRASSRAAATTGWTFQTSAAAPAR